MVIMYLAFSAALFVVGCLFGFFGWKIKSMFLGLASATVISFALLGMAHSIKVGTLILEVPLMLAILVFSFFMLYYGLYIDQVLTRKIKEKIAKLKREINMIEQDYIAKRISKKEMIEEIRKLEFQIKELEYILDREYKLPIFSRFFIREMYAMREIERK